MKRSLSLMLATGIIFGFLACNNKQNPEQKTSPALESKADENKVEGIKIETASLARPDDPVCGMSVKEGVNDTATVDGKLYGFCSSGCKDEFIKEPSRYIK